MLQNLVSHDLLYSDYEALQFDTFSTVWFDLIAVYSPKIPVGSHHADSRFG